MLSDYFLELFGKLHSVGKKQLSREALNMFMAYPWPGNIRELKNQIERLVFLADKREIIEEHLIPETIALAAFSPECPAKVPAKDMALQNALKSLEKDMVNNALSQSGWNRTRAANTLGISRATLNKKIAEFSLQTEMSLGKATFAMIKKGLDNDLLKPHRC